jgi:hypothetical protein
MNRKRASDIIVLSTILVVLLFASYEIHPSVSAQTSEITYVVVGGTITSSTQLGIFPKSIWTVPFASRPPYLRPKSMRNNITFSAPDPTTGIVTLTVPAASYVGLGHVFYDPTSSLWYNLSVTMTADGYGWLFTGTGTDPLVVDVDCHTFSNNTGVYWRAPSPMVGQQAALPGEFPSLGPDSIPGTGDDGFGDGTPDPPGSSVIFLPTTLTTDYWTGIGWSPLFSSPWPQILTTGTTYAIVDEPESELNGIDATGEGQPWEFLAGLDHPGQIVDWGDPMCNAYVHTACCWAILETDTPLGLLDVIFKTVLKYVRQDLVIADVNCDEIVDIYDAIILANSFGAYDEDWEIPYADPKYNAGVDIKPDGIIDIYDAIILAGTFGEEISP